MGLSNVRLEPVPVDVFEFEKASLTVGDRTMIASTIAGVPPSPAGGITAAVVYVKGGTAADFDAAGDVAGKLVLVDMKTSSWWFSLPALEAAHRRAAGVICTYTQDDTKYFSIDERRAGQFRRPIRSQRPALDLHLPARRRLAQVAARGRPCDGDAAA